MEKQGSEDLIVRLYEDYKNNKRDYQMTIEELGQLTEFSNFIDTLLSKNALINVVEKEREFEALITKAITEANEKYPHFNMSWKNKPKIHASLKSIYMHAHLSIATVNKEIRPLHIPMYYPFSTWKLLSESNLECEIMTIVASSIIKSLRGDISSNLINPLNFDHFVLYNLEVDNYAYGHEEIVLEVLSMFDSEQICLFYVWDVTQGCYVRKDNSSELAIRHLKYKELAEKLQK